MWEALLDPVALRAALPGCERFEESAPGVYDIAIRVGIAAIRGQYTGTVTLADPQPHDSYRLQAEGRAASGQLQSDARIELEAAGAATIVRYVADFQAQGPIARLGNRVLTGSANLLAGQFFKAMERQVRDRVP